MSSPNSDLSFKVLSLLSAERSIYGLRNNDNERYRRHCSNKLHRLRQVTGTTSGKGKVYKKPPQITEASVRDVKHLQLLLFSSERALAHSHEIKDDRKAKLSWLRRALSYSANLYSLSSLTPTQTRAEITIYHLSIRAELAFEKSQWADALTDLAIRRKLLSTLAAAAKDSYDEALANEFIDPFDPWIRFSAYKLGRAESHDIEGVVSDVDDLMEEALPGLSQLLAELAPALDQAESQRKTLADIEFAGQPVQLRSAEIVRVMIKVQNAITKVDKGGMASWDRVLSTLTEAESVAKKLLDDHEASASSSLRSTATSTSLSIAHQYILHLLLTHRIRRDLLLVDSLPIPEPKGRTKQEEAVKNLAAVVKLYDAVLQSLAQIRSLPIVEEKEEMRAGAEAAESYFHAEKCYNLARLHLIHPNPSYSSAVQLLERAARFQTASSSETQMIKYDPAPLAEKISALDLTAKRSLFAERVPKPVFFDTAFNYIDLPMEDLLVLAGKEQKEEAKEVKEIKQDVVEAAKPKAVAKLDRETRESTPAVEAKPTGWLGGWFKK